MRKKGMKIIKKNNGITLSNVVIVIIILIILAGISSEILLGNEGIITRAERAKEEQKIMELSEKLELVKAPTQVDKLSTVITVSEYLKNLQEPNIVDFKIDEIEKVDEDNAYVTVDDGYVFLIEYREDDNLIITYQGKAKSLKPRITKFELSTTTNSIKVKVEAKRADKYRFYIKDNIEGEYEFKEGNKKGEYTYSSLIQNKEYYIKVEAINQNGKVEQENKKRTGEMVVLTEAEIKAITEPSEWTKENTKTTIEIRTDKNVEGTKIQYAKLRLNATKEDFKSATWKEYTNTGIISEKNESIVTRLWDGVNATSYKIINITNIDKDKPVITEATATTNTITIKATDSASGIIGYTVTENTTVPTNFTSCNNTKSLNVNVENKTQGKTYYVWVKDKAGNVSEYKKVGTGKVTNLTTANTTFTYTPSDWTNKEVVATATTTVNGYTIQTSTDGKEWTDGASKTYTANGIVYARLRDTTGQVGGIVTGNINNIDKDKPVVNIESSTSGTITIKATDNESGIVGYAITETESQPTNFTTCTNTKTLDKVFDNLKHSTDYYIWVKDKAGNVNDKCLASTKDISDRVVYTIKPETWTNGTVKVTVSFPITGYTLKVRKTETANWSTTLSQSYTANGTIYVQVTEKSTGLIFYTQKDITNIDKTKPIITGVEDITFTTAKVKATDEASGLAKYAVSTSNANAPAASAFKDIENVGSLEAQIQVTGLTPNKTYYVWLKDVAGNISKPYKFVMMTDNVKPIITGVEDITFTTAKVNATDEASGLAKYAVSTDKSKAGTFKDIENVGSLEAQIQLTGLTTNKTYYVWVKDVAGNTSAPYQFVMMTDKVKPIITGVEDITYTTAKVNATDEASGLAKYAVSTDKSKAGTFKDIENVGSLEAQIQLTELKHNTTYYVWVKDVAGNTSAMTTFKTLKDTTLPSALIEYDKSTTLTIEAKVTHLDNETGVNISKCKWIYNQSSNALGTSASKYTGGTFTENGGIAKYNIKTKSGEFYLHILTVDNAGNAKETISGPIKVTPTSYHKHTGSKQNVTGYSGCYHNYQVDNKINVGFTYDRDVADSDGHGTRYYKSFDPAGLGLPASRTGNFNDLPYSFYEERVIGKKWVHDISCGKTEGKTIETCTITYP